MWCWRPLRWCSNGDAEGDLEDDLEDDLVEEGEGNLVDGNGISTGSILASMIKAQNSSGANVVLEVS